MHECGMHTQCRIQGAVLHAIALCDHRLLATGVVVLVAGCVYVTFKPL